MALSRALVLAACSFAPFAAGCGSTTDSLGDSRQQPTQVLGPLKGPAIYPNLFKELLGLSDDIIDTRVEAAFQRFFHGDSETPPVYSKDGNAAVILDTYHNDQRTEGYGLAMLIAVELDHQDEFDRIWRGAQKFRYNVGPYAGYFYSICDIPSGRELCVDPFGLQQFAMALLFASNRWKDSPSDVDYVKDASDLLYLMLHKEEQNGGDNKVVTNTFDVKYTKLVPYQPNRASAGITRPAIAMPAYYELWAQATGDTFFVDAAQAARDYLKGVADDVTGLTPVRSDFIGKPIPGFDTFLADSYRVQLNLMLDFVWNGRTDPSVDLSNRLLNFFSSKGLTSYGRNFTLDGITTLDMTHDTALVAASGMSAIPAEKNPDRKAFVQEVWNQAAPQFSLPPWTGTPRYYTGLMQLLAMLALSGKLQVH